MQHRGTSEDNEDDDDTRVAAKNRASEHIQECPNPDTRDETPGHESDDDYSDPAAIEDDEDSETQRE